jgi:hypothetical protein
LRAWPAAEQRDSGTAESQELLPALLLLAPLVLESSVPTIFICAALSSKQGQEEHGDAKAESLHVGAVVAVAVLLPCGFERERQQTSATTIWACLESLYVPRADAQTLNPAVIIDACDAPYRDTNDTKKARERLVFYLDDLFLTASDVAVVLCCTCLPTHIGPAAQRSTARQNMRSAWF